MKFDKYDNDSLINFYIENGLEFDERKKYFGNNIRSFALLENKNKTVSRDNLMIKLWETDNYVEENTLNVNVTRLRKKLESIGLNNFIKTKKGLGYIVE